MKTNRFILSVLSAAEVFTKPWCRGPGVRGQGKGAQVKVLRNSELKGEGGYLHVGITALGSPGAARSCSTTFTRLCGSEFPR